jgi:protein arginine kinase
MIGKRGSEYGSSNTLPQWFGAEGPESDIVISTRVRIARNIADHRFMPRASTGERGELYAEVTDALKNDRGLAAFERINFSAASTLCKRLLVEKRIASPELLSGEWDRGVAWQAMPFSAILINEEDHLRIQCIEPGCAPLVAWKRADAIDDRLGSDLNYAYSESRGYLTSRPAEAGTGVRTSFLLHLPGLVLTRAIDGVLAGASRMGIAGRSFFNDRSEASGNFFQLSGRAGGDTGEEMGLAAAARVITEVAAHERSARRRLLRDARLEITDKVFRAWGILLYAQTLSVTEFLNLSSALRLGRECGILPDFNPDGLDRAMVQMMPAHLQLQSRDKASETALSVMRAEQARKMILKKLRKRHAET